MIKINVLSSRGLDASWVSRSIMSVRDTISIGKFDELTIAELSPRISSTVSLPTRSVNNWTSQLRWLLLINDEIFQFNWVIKSPNFESMHENGNACCHECINGEVFNFLSVLGAQLKQKKTLKCFWFFYNASRSMKHIAASSEMSETCFRRPHFAFIFHHNSLL